MPRIRVNPLALNDLQEIKAYISTELSNPAVAASVVRRIISRYEQLAEYPMMGVELSALLGVKTDYRYLVSGNYLIFYRVEGEYVSIHRILNGRRDYMRILFGDLQENEEYGCTQN